MLVSLNKLGVVILAAGKGTRLNSSDQPKVMLPIGGFPILAYTVSTLQKVGFTTEQICVVVGFKKEQIENYFKATVSYAVQEEQLGTGHAAYVGIKSLPTNIEQVLVLGGDDGAFYSVDTIRNLLNEHMTNDSTLTLLTATVDDPAGFGRVVRDDNGVRVVEKEYLTEEQKTIHEVNTGTYVFNRRWFEEIFPRLPKMRKLGEYGMNPAITFAVEEGKKVAVIKLSDSGEWHGINTLEELQLADKLKSIK
ncbi:MAG: sugar phosphate nucleotidyltransferase [bacterium]|nr:sugar phosphate nucleotidyltransferase [bacterium]